MYGTVSNNDHYICWASDPLRSLTLLLRPWSTGANPGLGSNASRWRRRISRTAPLDGDLSWFSYHFSSVCI